MKVEWGHLETTTASNERRACGRERSEELPLV